MSAPKHTLEKIYLTASGNLVSCDSLKVLFCIGPPSDRFTPETRANAERVVALWNSDSAAPALLAQCQRFMGLLDRAMPHKQGEISLTPEAVAELRAALAKAGVE